MTFLDLVYKAYPPRVAKVLKALICLHASGEFNSIDYVTINATVVLIMGIGQSGIIHYLALISAMCLHYMFTLAARLAIELVNEELCQSGNTSYTVHNDINTNGFSTLCNNHNMLCMINLLYIIELLLTFKLLIWLVRNK